MINALGRIIFHVGVVIGALFVIGGLAMSLWHLRDISLAIRWLMPCLPGAMIIFVCREGIQVVSQLERVERELRSRHAAEARRRG